MSHNGSSCHPFSSSSGIPVGYHFNPTEAEVEYFLKEKNKNPAFSHQPIVTCDIYEVNPDDLARNFLAEEEDMYFFTQLNLKNDGGSRANRQAKDGFWVNKYAVRQGNSIGCKKSTLNFHEGEKSIRKKTDWLMKEYSLDEVEPPTMGTTTEACSRKGKRVAETQDDNPKKMKKYVLCQIYKKCKAKKTTKDPIDEVITECLSTTPGMQINSQGGTHAGIALEDHITPDQTNNRNEYLPATPGMSQDDTFADLGDIIMDSYLFDHHLNFWLDQDLHQPRDGS